MDRDRKKIIVHQKGKEVYHTVLALQTRLFEQTLSNKSTGQPTENHLIFCEHPPTYTLGKNGDESHLLFNPSRIGASFFKIDRGGDVTFHGPGQLVVYPIFDLANFDIGTAAFVSKLEEAVINLLSKLNIDASRLEGAAGIWVDVDSYPKKICAIGIKVSKQVTMHGIAINVTTDLSWFDKIVPCGLSDKGVTSLLKLTGQQFTLDDVATRFYQELVALL